MQVKTFLPLFQFLNHQFSMSNSTGLSSYIKSHYSLVFILGEYKCFNAIIVPKPKISYFISWKISFSP